MWDKVVGLCKGETCEGACGCAAGIPADSSITNFVTCAEDQAYEVVTHEIGHSLGLCHVEGCGASGACMDWCVNKHDCNDPEREEYTMDYCYPMKKYGPSGFEFLKNNVLDEYVSDCYTTIGDAI
jgi:hypothetical protein